MSGTFEGIPLPEQRPANGESFDVRPGAVDAWIRDLPLASIGETARRLFSALTQTNRTYIPAAERFRFIERLREPVDYVLKGMEKHYVGISLPLPEKNAKIALLTKSMLMELAIGYKLIHEAGQNNPDARLNRHQMILCHYRALSYLNLLLLNTYQTYMLVPPAIWREIHMTFQRAENMGAEDGPVDKGDTARTIATAYKQALLLALANPYSIGQKDLAALFSLLDTWSANCRLSKAAASEIGERALAVDLDGNAPPCAGMHHADARDIRLLDTRELTGLIRAQHSLQGEDKPSIPLARDILDRILASWECKARRGFSRSSKSNDVLVTIGLSAIYDFLSNPVGTLHGYYPDSSEVTHDRASFTAQHVSSASHDDMPDVWDLHKRPHEIRVETRLASEKTVHQSFSFRIVDESAGGYCLSQNSTEPPPQIRVGDLIMIFQNPGATGAESGLGIIRWIKNSKNLGFRIGIELVAPTATPVETALYGGGAQDLRSGFLRSLMLPELTVIRQPATLLTPTIYRSGTHLLLSMPSIRQHVKLTRRIEHTNCFSRYEFEVLKMLSEVSGDKAGLTVQPKSGKDENQGDFDNIWGII